MYKSRATKALTLSEESSQSIWRYNCSNQKTKKEVPDATKIVMRINASRFFPHRYRTNTFTSFNVGPVLLNSELHTHIPKVNRMHNGFAVWDNSVKSLVQVHPALLEACDQFLVVAAAGTLYVSSGRPSLDRQSHNPEEACREIHLWFSLHLDA